MVNGLKGKLVVHEGKNGTTDEARLGWGDALVQGHAGTATRVARCEGDDSCHARSEIPVHCV
jgi:hypothetical protein